MQTLTYSELILERAQELADAAKEEILRRVFAKEPLSKVNEPDQKPMKAIEIDRACYDLMTQLTPRHREKEQKIIDNYVTQNKERETDYLVGRIRDYLRREYTIQ